MSEFTEEVIGLIREIPIGRVSSYGKIACQAGNVRAARQVVRILHLFSEKEDLAWWRVVNAAGLVSLPRGAGFEEQCDLLASEGVTISERGQVTLALHEWVFDGAEYV